MRRNLLRSFAATVMPVALLALIAPLFSVTLFASVAVAADPAAVPNQNTLIKQHHDKLKLAASSFWGGWPASRAFDGDVTTSWFTARGDAAAKGTMPWIEVEFPVDIDVRRVTLAANREAPWEVGYTIRVGRVEFFGADGKVLLARSGELGGKHEELEVRPAMPLAGVRRIRFTSLQDDGDKNPYDDVAIGEMFVE